MDDAITYGAGMVILFHDAPDTGNTMMANALANKIRKRYNYRYHFGNVLNCPIFDITTHNIYFMHMESQL